MRNLHFKYAKAENFLCFGEEGIEINFESYSNIVTIKGRNLDVMEKNSEKASNGAGKCFSSFESILMYDGTIKLVQNIEIGDLVMGHDSTPRTVVNLHRGKDMMYKIIPKKGEPFTVNESHILSLKSSDKKYDRTSTNGKCVNITVKDYLQSNKTFKHLMRGYRSGVDFIEQPIKINPYFLGLWLGDGTSSGTGITNMDNVIIKEIYSDKHIPHTYKCNSKEIRLQLLAGLIDTDGHNHRHGGYEIVQKNKTLAKDILFLARSLGFAAYMKRCVKKCQTGNGGYYWRIGISGDCSQIPVKIEYKKCNVRTIDKDPLVFGFDIKPVGVGDYYGFTLKENPLFLLGDFTVVHNSSVPEIIVYGLYGKTIKKPKKLTHLNLINNQADKKLVVEVIWDDYRVVRKRDSSNQQTLQLWKSSEGLWNKDTEISKGKGTQAEIEKIVGLTYESFINIFIFSDDNTHPFLECDSTKKREIVENILSLEKYRSHSENAKELTKNIKGRIKDLTKEYEFLSEQKDGCISRISQLEKQELAWHEKMKKELDDLLEDIKKKRDELEQSSGGTALAAYQDAQEQIADLRLKIPVLEEQKTGFKTGLDDVEKLYKDLLENIKNNKDKVVVLKKNKDELEKLIVLNKKCIADIADKTSSKECPYCLGAVDEANFATIVEQAHKVIDENEPSLEICKKEYEEELAKSESFNSAKVKTDKGIIHYNNKINNLSKEINEAHVVVNKLCKITPPDSNVSELLLAEQFENLKKKASEKQDIMKGPSPFDEIKTAAVDDLNKKVQDCKQKKDDIKASEDLLPYYEFWVKAFGDTGIRKYVIDGIIPTLNDRIEYWLQFLIDNKIKLTFNSELEETIDRYPFNGRPYVYHGMSGGQRRRLNLTVAAAWAFVSALNSGSSPSVVFLDEVTMNVDAIGVHGIYRMICELAKEKQVFVIDHNEALLEMLNGSDTICLEMKDEVSKVVTSF